MWDLPRHPGFACKRRGEHSLTRAGLPALGGYFDFGCGRPLRTCVMWTQRIGGFHEPAASLATGFAVSICHSLCCPLVVLKLGHWACSEREQVDTIGIGTADQNSRQWYTWVPKKPRQWRRHRGGGCALHCRGFSGRFRLSCFHARVCVCVCDLEGKWVTLPRKEHSVSV